MDEWKEEEQKRLKCSLIDRLSGDAPLKLMRVALKRQQQTKTTNEREGVHTNVLKSSIKEE